MKVIQFVAKMSPYNIGETAGFEDERADEIVSRGAAVYVETVETVIDNSPVDRMIRRGRPRSL